jgi:hypothetical protein
MYSVKTYNNTFNRNEPTIACSYSLCINSSKEKIYSIKDRPDNKCSRSLKLPSQYKRPETERNNFEIHTPKSERNDYEPLKKIKTLYPPYRFRYHKPVKERTFPEIKPKEYKKESLKSEIQFNKQEDFITDNTKIKKKNYFNSDIFMNDYTPDRTGEKYLFKDILKPFTSTTLSKSEWADTRYHNNLVNHTSSKYNIINPCIKNISNTKEEITQYNPFSTYKQKSISQIVDLNHSFGQNSCKIFVNTLRNEKNPFNMINNVCSSYYDLQKSYNNITNRPFSKKTF